MLHPFPKNRFFLLVPRVVFLESVGGPNKITVPMKNLPKLDDWCLRLTTQKCQLYSIVWCFGENPGHAPCGLGRFDSFYKKESYQIISMDSGISSETSIEILRSVHRINSGPTTTHHVGCSFPPSGKSTKNTSPPAERWTTWPKKEPESVGTSFPKISWICFFPKLCFFPKHFWDEIIGWYDCIPSYQKCQIFFWVWKKSPPCNRQVRYQQGSSVLIFNLTTEITEEPLCFF